jgi:hypothetical protein
VDFQLHYSGQSSTAALDYATFAVTRVRDWRRAARTAVASCMIVISTPLSISSSVRDIERLLRESPPFRAGRMSTTSGWSRSISGHQKRRRAVIDGLRGEIEKVAGAQQTETRRRGSRSSGAQIHQEEVGDFIALDHPRRAVVHSRDTATLRAHSCCSRSLACRISCFPAVVAMVDRAVRIDWVLLAAGLSVVHLMVVKPAI